MANWQAKIDDNLLTSVRLTELDAWASHALTSARAPAAARQRWALTNTFLRDWLGVIATTSDVLNSPEAAALLKRRESWLKQGRARLGSPDLLRGWAGDSGYFHLDYNWSIAMLICGDIHGHDRGDGLGTPRRSATEAA